MTDTMPIAPLRVANEAFLVASMIERCPRTMMMRELVMNALEAAALARPGERSIVIGARPHEGARKLWIWNTGPGLDAAELLQITDLASSLRKENGLDRNFGMGAKVAALPSNRHMLRYRSCAGGRVSEVRLGYRQGIYGRLRIGPEGAEVIDATEACRAEGDHDLARDWTEVMLGGNGAAQDTVASPYGPSLAVAPDWLRAGLENRFFRLPRDVSLTLMPDVCSNAAPCTVVGAGGRARGSGRAETRITPSGVAIHYEYDPQAGASRGAVVFRDEIYDLRAGEAWLQDAPNYGIPFGAGSISVHVELPADYLVWPDAYRQFLRFRGHDQRQLHLADFSALVRSAMPAWLADIIRGFGPGRADYLDAIGDELKRLLAELKVPPQQAPVPPAGEVAPPKVGDARPPGEVAKTDATPPAPSTPLRPKPPAFERPVFERPPEIIGLRTAEQVRERGLDGRAAKFYPQTHQAFINLAYPAVEEMAAALLAEAAPPGGATLEEMRRIATETAEWALTKRIARAVVYSLAKKGRGWRPEEIARAQSTESLSLVADDWASALEMAQTRLQSWIAAEGLSAIPRPVAA